MKLNFEMDSDSKAISIEELNAFETMIGKTLPQDYRQHMLTYNGGVIKQNVNHVNYPDSGGISYFYPIKYGYDTMEDVYEDFCDILPNGFISIGKTDNGGYIIISLTDDSSYGKIREFFSDGETRNLSLSFTELLNNMVEDD